MSTTPTPPHVLLLQAEQLVAAITQLSRQASVTMCLDQPRTLAEVLAHLDMARYATHAVVLALRLDISSTPLTPQDLAEAEEANHR